MGRKLVVMALVFGMATGAYAEWSMYVDLYQTNTKVASFGPEYWTADMRVKITNNDDWLSTTGEAEILGNGTFYEHAFGGNTPPSKALVAAFAELEYDSFYAAAATDAANQPPSAPPSFAGIGPQNDPKKRWGNNPPLGNLTWFKTPPNGGDGDWLLARYTVKLDPGEEPLTLDDKYPVFLVMKSDRNVGTGTAKFPTLRPYDLKVYQVPEPGALALLSLGGFVGLIRRR